MNFTLKIILYVLGSFCIATAQILLSLYAKGIPSPFCCSKWLLYSLFNPFLYGGILLYGISFVMFIMLLRFFPTVQVTLSIITLVMLMMFIYNYLCGLEFTLVQYCGGIIALIGLFALNWNHS